MYARKEKLKSLVRKDDFQKSGMNPKEAVSYSSRHAQRAPRNVSMVEAKCVLTQSKVDTEVQMQRSM